MFKHRDAQNTVKGIRFEGHPKERGFQFSVIMSVHLLHSPAKRLPLSPEGIDRLDILDPIKPLEVVGIDDRNQIIEL